MYRSFFFSLSLSLSLSLSPSLPLPRSLYLSFFSVSLTKICNATFFQSYRQILEIDPGNVQGLHNLCVVHVERGHLQQAEKCLEKAKNLAPNEEYITRHLAIVRERIATQRKTQSGH
jgi:tetratricopeptide (TPR) repeat protein